ncbi:MAG TPA: glucoamylase family protein [Acidobacteriota bacterium]|nr:glucoamylase family protein [Acidobacteriota bacterium]
MWRSAASFVLGAALATAPAGEPGMPRADEKLLDDLERAGVLYFWEQADQDTGLVKDRSLADGSDNRAVGSIAAGGFGLTALCIADQRGYIAHNPALARAKKALWFLARRLPAVHGFYYHFNNVHTGERAWNCELSSIDTAILLCGVLTCRQYFDDSDIRHLARQIDERIDWPWMANSGATLTMGWKPESGFLKSRWDGYNEAVMLYLLAIGSPAHPLPPSAWSSFKRPLFEYGGLRYIHQGTPLFTHQYPHGWFDFQGRSDKYEDYFQNSILATRAHRLFCISLHDRFPSFSADLWGVTSSDSAKGYVAWGGPPALGPLDGTVVPAAAGGSIAFLPRETIHTLRSMRDRFGDRIWKRYGFVDAFNPQTGWVDPDVIGIDVGITLLMAENVRSRFVWRTFMKNEEARRAMDLAGLRAAGSRQ